MEKFIVHQAKTAAFGFSGDDIVPRIQPGDWKKFGLTESLLESIIDEVEGKLVEVKNFSLEVQAGDESKT